MAQNFGGNGVEVLRAVNGAQAVGELLCQRQETCAHLFLQAYAKILKPLFCALAALGPDGIDHLIDLLCLDLIANMGQLGAQHLGDLPPPITLD